MELSNSTLTSLQGFLSSAPDVTLTLDRTDLEKAMIGIAPLQQHVAEGTAVVEGNPSVLTALAGMLTEFDPTFAIMPGTIPGCAPLPADAFEYRDIGDSSG